MKTNGIYKYFVNEYNRISIIGEEDGITNINVKEFIEHFIDISELREQKL